MKYDWAYNCCRYLQSPGMEGPKILALGLSSRKNLCIHPRVAGRLLWLRQQCIGEAMHLLLMKAMSCL